MEEINILNPSVPMDDANQSKIKMYYPAHYAFLGFFLSLVPVFVMSFANAKLMPNGAKVSKRMRIFLIIFVLLILGNISAVIWASLEVASAVQVGALADPGLAIEAGLTGSDAAFDQLSGGTYSYATKILNNVGVISIIINLVLLFFVVKFTNKTELEYYNNLKAHKKVEARRFLVPVVAGLAFSAFLYFGMPVVVQKIVEIAI